MQIFICDDCKDRVRNAQRAQLGTGRFSPDAAGGPLTEDVEHIDLCLSCAITRLERACSPSGMKI